MKSYQIVLLVIIVVTLNNVVLLNLLGYFSKELETPSAVKPVLDQAEPKLVSPKPDQSVLLTKEVPTVTNDIDEMPNSHAFESDAAFYSEVANAVKQFALSAEFEQVLERYQANAAPRYEKMQSQLSAMNSSELYALAIDSGSPFEQRYAQQLLVQGGLDDLEAVELKNLYLTEGLDSWIKQSILPKLLDEGDLEAVGWAKQVLVDGPSSEYLGPEFYEAVYEADPDFVTQHINNLDLDGSRKSLDALTFVMQDTDLSKEYYNQNFDKILDAKSSQTYQYLYNKHDLELSNQQQSQLSEFFGSKSRHRRNFAINQVKNIDDVHVLRDSYSLLNRDSEKLTFLKALSDQQKDTEVIGLIKELAADSDAPEFSHFRQ